MGTSPTVKQITYFGFWFNGISVDTQIVGVKLSLQAKVNTAGTSSNPCYFEFRFVTGFKTDTHNNDAYTSIGSSQEFFRKTQKDNDWIDYEYSNTDINSTELQWIRNNMAKVLGGTQFGVRFRGRKTDFRNVYVTLYYTPISKIYIGGGACIGGLRRRHTG